MAENNTTFVERRKHPRIELDGNVEVYSQNNKKIKFALRDLSLGGISFYPFIQNKYSKGDPIKLSLRFPQGFVDDIFDSKCEIIGKCVEERVDSNQSKKYLAVEFDKNLKELVAKIYRSRKIKALLIVPFVFSILILLKTLNIKYYWYHPVLNIYSLIVTTYILSRFVLAAFYKPPKVVNYLPTLSLIIPVKNDEVIIAKTIKNCYSSDYPREKIEVIVVNDGSTDNTLNAIEAVQREYPQLKVVDFQANQGKREAMAAGVKLCKGEILVFVDSDSLIDKKSLFYLVQGLADPSVGAVCGHAYILNAEENILTKMQEVRYFVAFRAIKAAEHMFSSVTCCSGSLSAYRRSYVEEVLRDWLGQKFLGTITTFGDDRSLTNYILKKYHVLYDNRATVRTVAPAKWKGFFTQQLRWKKSWFRESLIASNFMWYKHPIAAISFYLGFLIPLISPGIVFVNFFYKPLFFGQLPLYYLLGFGMISFIYCLFYIFTRPNSKWYYGIYFCFLYVAFLSWQTYYAIITSHKNKWGTR